MAPGETPDKQLLPERVARQIEAMILDGSLAVGQSLPPERELCDKLSVSRNSLREALKELRARGVIETRRGSGTRVAFFQEFHPSTPLQSLLQNHPDTLHSLLEVRRTLEGEAAYYAAERANAADLEALRAVYEPLVADHSDADLPEGHAARDIAFHQAIYSAAHNPVLLLALNGIRDLMMSFFYGTSNKLYPLAQSRRALKTQHRRIYRAIVAREPAAARRAATAHIDAVAASLRELDN
jgi:GntR family transcriptional activator of glc operon